MIRSGQFLSIWRCMLVGSVLALFATVDKLEAVTVDFDTFPGSVPVPDTTIINTQYSSLGVVFSSTAPAGAPAALQSAEATSSPNILVGAVVNTAGLYDIDMDFTLGLPSNVGANLISVGTAIVTAKAYASDLVTVLDSVSVTHGPGAGNGFGNVDPISLSGLGIARVRFSITQTSTTVDGYGIDDISFPNVVPEPMSLLLAGLGSLGLISRRRLRR